VRGRCIWGDTGGDTTDTKHFGIDDAIATIGNTITPNDFFFFSEICHGPDPSIHADVDGARLFYVRNANLQFSTLADAFDTHLGGRNNPKKYTRMSIVLQSCCSGRALNANDGLGHLEGKERIIITATQRNELSWCTVGLGITGTNDDHWAFLYCGIITNLILWVPYIEYQHDGFTTTLGSKSSPNTIKSAFDNGNLAASNNGVKMYSIWKDKLTSTPILWEYSSLMASQTYL
jgi:hypothetical protein